MLVGGCRRATGLSWVNAVMALPFVLRALMPVMYQQERRFRNVYLSLGIQSWSRWRLEWPLVRVNVAQALGYALLLSLGDMGVIALFGSQGLVSLPLYLFLAHWLLSFGRGFLCGGGVDFTLLDAVLWLISLCWRKSRGVEC